MRIWILFLLLPFTGTLVLSGCGSLQVEAGFKQPAELTATAVAQSAPTPAPKPQLGRLAFVRGGDIWVKELSDGEATRLTKDGHNNTPRWSPSGQWLTFQKDDKTAWVMRADSTQPHQVEPDLKAQLFWSPVSDQLAYNSLGGIHVINPDGSGKRELVPPPGKEPGASPAGSPLWSPAGEWIAFGREQMEPMTSPPPKIAAQSVYRIKADGTSLTEVYRNPEPSKPLRLVDWSPDGQYLLAWRDDLFPSNSGAADGWPLFALPLSGGSTIKVSEMVLLDRDFLSWAPTDHDLALIDGGNRSTWYGKHLAVSDLSGPAQLRSDPSRADLFPAWSPDGRSIAYTSAPEVKTDGGNDAKQAAAQRKIWVVQPDGSGRYQLTSDPNYRDERPQWSLDGAYILFGRFYQSEQMQLWLMRSDGSDLRQVVDELTPTPGPADAWFGYYGTVGWGSLYDWWQGPPARPRGSAATAGPKAGPSSSPTRTAAPASGPTAGSTAFGEKFSAFLQSAAAYLASEEAQGQPESTVSARLQELAGSAGLSLTYLKRSEGEPEAWVGASPQAGFFLLWRQGGSFAYQTWRAGTGQGFSLYLVNRPVALRLVERDGSLEMGLIPANLGSTADAWFVLARLTNGQWQEVWSPLPAARDSWASGGGKVEFVGQGIDVFGLTGPIPRDVPASRVFNEFGVFLKQQYESEWHRQGDSYVQVAGHVVPNPMTALADFVDRLQRGDKVGAARLAVDSEVVERALGMKLDVPAGGSGWIGGPQTEEAGNVRIRFFDSDNRQRSYVATIASQSGEWRVKSIEQIPPVPGPGAAAAPTLAGGR